MIIDLFAILFFETHLGKRIRRSARRDRARWLDVIASSWSWHAIKQDRVNDHGPSKTQGRLRELQGSVVDSNERAQTLADYFEQVQWRVRICSLRSIENDDSTCHPISTCKIALVEIRTAAKKLKNHCASGENAIPSEFWKQLLHFMIHMLLIGS